MSTGRNRKKRSLGEIIFILIILNATKGLWVNAITGVIGGVATIIGALVSVIGGLAIFVGFIAIIAAVLTKLSRSDSDTRRRSANRPTKNPYSANYNKEAAQNDANAKKADVVIDGNKVKEIKVEPEVKKEEPKHRTTGDPEIDKIIIEKDLAIEEMKRLDDAILDEKLSEQIVHLEAVTEKIVDYIITHPKKKNQVNKFFNYYLPTTLKLLNAYDRMDDTGISGTNIDGTKGKVEEMMDTALSAFDKQLDALFADEALDVSTDIKVMENMLKAEGLTDDDITLKI